MVIIAILLTGSAALFSFRMSGIYDHVFTELGLSEQEARYSISTSFLYGYLQHYSAKNIKNIAAGNRAEVVKELGAFVKEYVKSEDFKSQYAQMREQKKPTAPELPHSAEEISRLRTDEIRKSIASIEESMGRMQDDMKPVMQSTIDMFNEQLKDYENPESETIISMAGYEQMSYEFNMGEYQKKLTFWEEEWPSDPMQFVKKRLQESLDRTKDVDFSAALKDGYGGRKVFVNPQYESRNAEWKKAYRAGKEATMAAREFASQWLEEIK
jgi:hypothetical protein